MLKFNESSNNQSTIDKFNKSQMNRTIIQLEEILFPLVLLFRLINQMN